MKSQSSCNDAPKGIYKNRVRLGVYQAQIQKLLKMYPMASCPEEALKMHLKETLN